MRIRPTPARSRMSPASLPHAGFLSTRLLSRATSSHRQPRTSSRANSARRLQSTARAWMTSWEALRRRWVHGHGQMGPANFPDWSGGGCFTASLPAIPPSSMRTAFISFLVYSDLRLPAAAHHQVGALQRRWTAVWLVVTERFASGLRNCFGMVCTAAPQA